MPFGIKLRKHGRYILSHKNSFLVRVQLLDNTVTECTLTVENTGNDCLLAVANKAKLNLKEFQYFGLQYINKQYNVRRWVELDKPLKKQVDKFSLHPTLYFGVVYYVANIDSLQQNLTRYLFYLQFKNNIIDSQIQTNVDQAIELASYMLQAEFGDYNPKEHTLTFFRDYILFPEILTPDESTLDSLTEKTIYLHQRHRGLTAPDAEYNYVMKVLCLDGYAEEKFLVKDLNGGKVHLGCNLSGVFFQDILKTVTNEEGHEQYDYGQITLYEWSDIAHITYNKFTLSLDMEREETDIQFQLDDVESAKYLCRIIEGKRKFYVSNKETSRKLTMENGDTAIQRRPTLRRTQDVAAPEVPNSHQHDGQATLTNSHSDILSSQENLHDYTSNNTSHEAAQYYASQTSLDHAYVSQTSLNHIQQPMPQEYGYLNGGNVSGSMYSSPSINSLAHSQTHLNMPSPTSSNLSLCSSDVLHGNIPGYRCTPDYEVALRQRRRYSSYLENQIASQQPTTNSVPNPHLKPRPHSMIYSPQELMHQAINGPHYAHYPPQHPPLQYQRSNPPNRVDSLTHLHSSQQHLQMQMNASHESLTHQHPPHIITQINERNEHPSMADNAMLAASTPELQQQLQANRYSGSEMQLYRHITKPPPPYPRNNSNSTPDLSARKISGVSASTPDLYQANMAGVPENVAMRQHQPQPHQMPANRNYQMPGASNQDIIIRGVCTGVETNTGYLRNDMAHKPQHEQPSYQMLAGQQRSEQAVQAYLQQISREEAENSEENSLRQRQQSRVHRPVSYPPRINQSHAVLSGVDENNLLFTNGNNRMASIYQQVPSPLHSSHSQLSSSTGTPYGSQQHLQGSQGSLSHNSYQAPHTHANMQDHHPQYHNHADQPNPASMPMHDFHHLNREEHNNQAQNHHEMIINFPPAQQRKNLLENEYSIQYYDPQIPPVQQPAYVTQDNNKIPHKAVVHEEHYTEPYSVLDKSQEYDPPHSYRQPSQSDSVVEEEEVPAVFPHPNPSSHAQRLQYETSNHEQPSEDDETAAAFADKLSANLRISRHSIKRRSTQSKASSNEVHVSTPSSDAPDEKVIALEHYVDEGHVLMDYKAIAEQELPHDKIIVQEHEKKRDRVKSVVPYQYNCVQIQSTSDNPTGYINASYVKVEHSNMLWNYIACQNPMDEFQHEFWEMVWDNNLSIIVMLSKEMENGKNRCSRYWPTNTGDANAELYGYYRVTQQSVTEIIPSTSDNVDDIPSSPSCSNVVTTRLLLQKAGEIKTRDVWHLQYIGWPDSGAPKHANDFLSLIHELESLKRMVLSDDEHDERAPVLVHCASGAGRTGVLVLSQIMIHILTHNGSIDNIPLMLQEIRSQRMQMVQTVSQYNFVYQLLILFLKNSRLI